MDQPLPLNMGLSEEEKSDLEKMIADFQHDRLSGQDGSAAAPGDVEAIKRRLAYLSRMFLAMDRRMQSLYEAIRLLLEKSDILNQRIDTIIDSLRSGDPL